MLGRLTGRRVMRVGAQAAVLTAVVAGTVAYVHRGRDVTLVVDGRAISLQADAADVRGLLADEGVQLSSHDFVAPGRDTRLADGQRVVVWFARPLRITLDGVPRTYWTTERTVDAALTALGIRTDGARLSVARSRPLGRAGLDLVISHPKTVDIAADGRTRRVTSTASTAAELLSEAGVVLRGTDQLSVLPSSPVVDGLVVAVTRIDRRRVTVTETVPPPVTRRPAVDLEVGRQRVVTAGRPGTRTATYSLVLANGKVAGRELISASVLKKPTNRVVRVGTKPAAPKSGAAGGDVDQPVAGADGLNWAALARCESGGNPRAVNPAGYYGLYQFSPATWRSVGGSGLPSNASAGEQLYRAKLLYKRGGARQWGCGRHLYD